MSIRKLIYVVDDDPTISMLISAILDEFYEIECFDSSLTCLQALAKPESKPEAFLLDVNMPEIDGYTLCKKIRETPAFAKSPVIFISAKDSLDDVLAGYEAGAQDYLTKLFEPEVLLKKLATLLQISTEQEALRNQAENSDLLASVFMTNLDEYAVLIKYLRALNESHTREEIAEKTLEVLGAYRLQGAIQIRLRDSVETYSKEGQNLPMETAVINHVREQGRIFEFKSRSVYNFDHVTILVTNMPLNDPDLCGRIRDNPAIVAESANGKLLSYQAMEDKLALRGEIAELMQGLESFIAGYAKRFDEAHFKSTIHTSQLVDHLMKMVAHLGLTIRQEDELVELVKSKSESLTNLFNFAEEQSTEIASFQSKLTDMLSLTTEPSLARPA